MQYSKVQNVYVIIVSNLIVWGQHQIEHDGSKRTVSTSRHVPSTLVKEL